MISRDFLRKTLRFSGIAVILAFIVIAFGTFASPSLAGDHPKASAGDHPKSSAGDHPKSSAGDHPMSSMAKFDKEGNLVRPEGFREWVYVGTPLTPNEMNEGKAPFPEFHSVYIDPASWKHYKKTGKFRDGTILVKELISVGSKEAPSGKGYFMGEYLGLEATVKDSKRYAKEPGHWAYFSFTAGHGEPLKDKAPALPTSACNTCHDANAAEDWVFTQFYPVLRAAKPE